MTDIPCYYEQTDFSKWGPVSKKPLSPLRQVIARRMSESWNAVPRVTQFDEADITALMDLRPATLIWGRAACPRSFCSGSD